MDKSLPIWRYSTSITKQNGQHAMYPSDVLHHTQQEVSPLPPVPHVSASLTLRARACPPAWPSPETLPCQATAITVLSAPSTFTKQKCRNGRESTRRKIVKIEREEGFPPEEGTERRHGLIDFSCTSPGTAYYCPPSTN